MRAKGLPYLVGAILVGACGGSGGAENGSDRDESDESDSSSVDSGTPSEDSGSSGDAGTIDGGAEGCIATVVSLCGAVRTCGGEMAEEYADQCDAFTELEVFPAGCAAFVEMAIAEDVDLACWVQEASSSDVEACFSFDCENEEALTAVMEFAEEQSVENGIVLFSHLLADCPSENACDASQ